MRTAGALDFIERQSKAGKPFFCWMNSTRMHFRTHVRAEHRSPSGLTALTEYADGMVEHDAMVGTLLKKLDDLGIADITIVLYTTDNGPHMNSWPDGAMTPFHSEKNTNAARLRGSLCRTRRRPRTPRPCNHSWFGEGEFSGIVSPRAFSYPTAPLAAYPEGLRGPRRPHGFVVAERHRGPGPVRRRLGEAHHRPEMAQSTHRRVGRHRPALHLFRGEFLRHVFEFSFRHLTASD